AGEGEWPRAFQDVHHRGPAWPRLGGESRGTLEEERRAERRAGCAGEDHGEEAVSASRFLPWLFAASLWGQPPLPADTATLRPLFEQALADRAREWGPEHPKTDRGASDLGLFLKAHGDAAGAESALRRALAIDEKSLGERDSLVAADRENLAALLEAGGHLYEAATLYARASEGPDKAIQARCFGKLAGFEEARAA